MLPRKGKIVVNQWSSEQQWITWFYSGVLAVSQKHNLIARDYQPTQPIEGDEKLLTIASQFMSEVNPLSAYTAPQDAAAAFKLWAGRWSQKVKPIIRQHVECRIERDLGGLKVSFGWAGEFDLTTDEGLVEAYRYAVDMVNRAFSDFGATNLPKMPAVQNAPQETEKFFGERVITETKDGKKYHKVMGGQFTKYGVRVWPEALRAAGIDPDALSSDAPFSLNRDCYCTVNEGRPGKVTRIE